MEFFTWKDQEWGIRMKNIGINIMAPVEEADDEKGI